MHDAAAVRGGEPLGDARQDPAQSLGRKRTVPEHGIERAALDVGQHHEQPAAGLLDPVDGADRRVIERRERAGLAFETRPRLGIRGLRGMNELERNRAVELEVVGAIDLAHAAGAERAPDAKVPDDCADHEAARPPGSRIIRELYYTSARPLACA